MKSTEERLAKLPAWARGYIEDLERGKNYAERVLAEDRAAREITESRIKVYGAGNRSDFYLADDKKVQVRFNLTDGRGRFEIDIDPDEQSVRVSHQGGYDDVLVVRPEVSNVVNITTMPRR